MQAISDRDLTIAFAYLMHSQFYTAGCYNFSVERRAATQM